jgi:NADH:ubiquinone oxidoreductase subunit B-like Fe-S oxidoreductase
MGLIETINSINSNGFVQSTVGELIKWGQKNSPWPNGLYFPVNHTVICKESNV